MAENHILKAHLRPGFRLTDSERIALAEIGKRLGRKALQKVAHIAKPDTLLAWYRRLIAHKFDGSKQRRSVGRPGIHTELENLVVRLACENSDWGYDRIVGALANLGHLLSDQAVRQHSAPSRNSTRPQAKSDNYLKEFIRRHMDVLSGTDSFTVEVLTWKGLVTYYVLFFLHLESRRVTIAGISAHPDQNWMQQIGRNATLEHWGYLHPCRYVLHDRDTKFSALFQDTLATADVKCLAVPRWNPNLNAFVERWVRSVRDECLSKLILFGESSLRRALTQFTEHYHRERNHQGKRNVLLFPDAGEFRPTCEQSIQCRERLGGLLKYYDPSVA